MTPDAIIIHCSATRNGHDFRSSDIDRWHREQGFAEIGYHYVIDLDGTIEVGRPLTMAGAHCKGWNKRSIGICYIGGLDANGMPADTPSTVLAPFAADIIYATNIKEAVRQLPQNYISVGAMQDFLAALGTQMGGTWSMRPNDNGKFTFTFTPNQNNG